MKKESIHALPNAGNLLLTVLLLAALLAGSLLFPARVQAGGGGGAIINTTQDETETNTFCSLREAIINSNNDAATHPAWREVPLTISSRLISAWPLPPSR